jgi:Heterokaryon incompatibility protein (HET)
VKPILDTSLERILGAYGGYLNLTAGIATTNASLFRIRNWLRNCQQHHAETDEYSHCKPLNEALRGSPLMLIDIEKRCLVKYEPFMSFVALSYVWGDIDTAVTAQSNYDRLQEEGSLTGPGCAVDLPFTVRDAMFFTGFIGCHYLWCDRLCIVQDDQVLMDKQIQQMAEIYASAYCTIAALDNLNANSGLRGMPSLSIGSDDGIYASISQEEAKWTRRAWTFQEELFSTRIIWLSKEQISWQCPYFNYPESTNIKDRNGS